MTTPLRLNCIASNKKYRKDGVLLATNVTLFHLTCVRIEPVMTEPIIDIICSCVIVCVTGSWHISRIAMDGIT